MKRFRVYIINLIGFNKTEAQATIILLGIVLMGAIMPRAYVRYSHKPVSTTKQDQQLLSEWLVEIDNSLKKKEIPKTKKKTAPKFEPFRFDPNLASDSDLQKLGFKPYIASRIIKYREAGGNFRTTKDLQKIFGIDSLLVEKLIPYISITPPRKNETLAYTKTAKEEKTDPTNKPPKLWMDLNMASDEELQKIRGIGPFYAKNILNYRQKLGGFYSMTQLNEVYRMTPSVLNLLKDHTFIGAPTQKLPINSEALKDLAEHPYITWNQAKVIVNYRKQHGTFTDAEELLNIKIIDDSLYQKISPYISVEP